MIWIFAIIPGVLVGYFMFMRPVLKALPALKDFYAEADGFWAKVWAVCGKSVTMAWSYFLAGVGVVLQWIEPLSTALGDPDFKSQVTNTLQTNPAILGYVLMGISAVTLAARLRSITRV